MVLMVAVIEDLGYRLFVTILAIFLGFRRPGTSIPVADFTETLMI
jgi:hypothetical protein